jgi:hypothetical protein
MMVKYNYIFAMYCALIGILGRCFGEQGFALGIAWKANAVFKKPTLFFFRPPFHD